MMTMTSNDDGRLPQQLQDVDAAVSSHTSGPSMQLHEPSQKHVLLRGCDILLRGLYGKSCAELTTILCLGATLFFMTCGYWLLRSLRDQVFIALCGVHALPMARAASAFVILMIILTYNLLLSRPQVSNGKQHLLFYVFGTAYFILLATVGMLLTHPDIGLDNPVVSEDRLLGWVSYCAIDSFGAIMVTFFWSFCNSNMSLDLAQSGYGILLAMAQVGSIAGSKIAASVADKWGIAFCYFVGASCALCLQGSVHLYVRWYGRAQPSQHETSACCACCRSIPGSGMFEGLVLFCQSYHAIGALAISCLHMIPMTMLDYAVKIKARDIFLPCKKDDVNCYHEDDAVDALKAYFRMFGSNTDVLSLILTLAGTSVALRYSGVGKSLLVFPILLLIVGFCILFQPTLYVLTSSLMLLKAGNFALHIVTKEILFVSQQHNATLCYKTRSWIDLFGMRLFKALGSIFIHAIEATAAKPDVVESLVTGAGGFLSTVVAILLLCNATILRQSIFDENFETSRRLSVAGGTLEASVEGSNQEVEMLIQGRDEADGFDNDDGDSHSQPNRRISMVVGPNHLPAQ